MNGVSRIILTTGVQERVLLILERSVVPLHVHYHKEVNRLLFTTTISSKFYDSDLQKEGSLQKLGTLGILDAF